MFLSFIVPFYNVEQYIEECLRSLCNQDIASDQYEIICINDCSPDNSIEIIKQLQNEYKNIILVEHIENKKLGGARNTGLKYAKGEYVWFVDSDDFIQSNVLGYLRDILSKEKVDFLHFNYLEFKEGKIIVVQENESIEKINGVDLFLHSSFDWSRDHIVAWCKIYRRQFILEYSLYFAEKIMYEDNDYALMSYFYAKNVKHISTPLYIYRTNENSITRVRFSDIHILYWLKLSGRLIKLHNKFSNKKYNLNVIFSNEIKYFIKNIIYKIFATYSNLTEYEKIKARKYIKDEISIKYRPYMSLKNYLKIKLGII